MKGMKKLSKDTYTSSFEVNPLTLAVTAKFNEFGELQSQVLEDEAEYIVEVSPSKLIDYACTSFGASLKGRQDATRNICGITHKAPIAVDPASGMYFFPTCSPTNVKCSWIAHSHIDQLKQVANQQTKVMFKNGKNMIVDVSYGSMLNQLQRTAQYRYLLSSKIKLLQDRPDWGLEPLA